MGVTVLESAWASLPLQLRHPLVLQRYTLVPCLVSSMATEMRKSKTYQQMEVTPTYAALISVKNAFARRSSGHAKVVTNFLGMLVQLNRDHVKVEVVADDCLLEVGIKLGSPLILANKSVCAAQLETLSV